MKSWPLTKSPGGEVGRAHERIAVRVGDAGVEHGDDDARAARVTVGDQVRPGLRRVDAVGAGEVPLQALPAAGRAGAAGVVGEERRRLIGGHRAERVIGRERRRRGGRRRVRDVVGHGPGDAAAAAQPRDRGRDAEVALQDHGRERRPGLGGARDPGARERGVGADRGRAAAPADDDDPRLVRRPRRRRARRARGRAAVERRDE